MSKGHLTEYVKGAEKTKKNDNKDNDEEAPVNQLVTSVIDAIHATTTRDAVTRNAIRVHIKRA